ncbi:MAG: c-type cytochrome [Opitutaceae bacterium]
MILRCLLISGLAFICAGCRRSEERDYTKAFPEEVIRQGVHLMPTHCNTCHGVGDRKMEEMLAPPLLSARAHYLAIHPDPEGFVDAVTKFLTDPQSEHSLMPKSVERYGLKSPVSLSEDEIRLVASAVYAGFVERPVWLASYKKEH